MLTRGEGEGILHTGVGTRHGLSTRSPFPVLLCTSLSLFGAVGW
jgi:hypothetical protein